MCAYLYTHTPSMRHKARVVIFTVYKMEFKTNVMIPKLDENEKKVHFVYEYILTVENIS